MAAFKFNQISPAWPNSFNNNLLRHQATTQHLQGVNPSRQTAHVDGALAFHGEEHHHLALHIEHHHTDGPLVVVGAESELALGGIGEDVGDEGWFGVCFMEAHQQALVVAEGYHLARHTQHWVVGGGALGAGHAIDAVGVVGVAEVEIGRVELVEQLGLSGGEVLRKVVVPHEADAAWAPSATVVNPSAVLRLAACRIGGAGAPQVLVVLVLPVHEDVVRGFEELGGVARVVAVVGAAFNVVVPYIIFTILLLTFTAVDITKLRFKPLFVWIILFQVVVSLGNYALLKALGANEIIAEGILVGVLCPVAASVAVVSTMLGADRETVTSYAIIGNLMVSIVAPVYFSFIGVNQEMPFLDSFLQILRRIGTVIGLPFFLALALQLLWPKANRAISRYKGLAFYLWAVALFLTLGQTIHFIFLNGKGNWSSIGWLGVSALLFCIVQFGLGKWIGHKYGDTIAGGQLMGQKNSAMGIWMANHYLHPLASVYLAFYSVLQNLFNSWQLWRKDHKKGLP